MQTEINKAICRRFIQEIFNQGELSRIRDFIAADAWNHELGDEPAPPGRSPRYYANLVELYRHAFPDLHFEIRGQIAEDDRVVTRLQFRGTQKNPLLGIPSQGKSMAVDGIRIDHLVDGKIAESWFQWDSVGMLRQLGTLPSLWEGRQGSTAEPAAAGTVVNLPGAERAPAVAARRLRMAS